MSVTQMCQYIDHGWKCVTTGASAPDYTHYLHIMMIDLAIITGVMIYFALRKVTDRA